MQKPAREQGRNFQRRVYRPCSRAGFCSFTYDQIYDTAEFPPHLDDLKPRTFRDLSSSPVEMIVDESDGGYVQQIEQTSKQSIWPDVFEQNDLAARTYHAPQFRKRLFRLRYRAKYQRRKRRVKFILAERQTLGVGLYQMIFASFGIGDLKHADRDLARNGMPALRIKFEIGARTATEFEDRRIFGQQGDSLLPPTR